MQLQENQEPSDENDRWNFFKLSYAANENFPAIVNCLELRSNEKYGRHIITNQDLNPGDIIAVEKRSFNNLNEKGSYIRCANCLKSNKMSLIPFYNCAK